MAGIEEFEAKRRQGILSIDDCAHHHSQRDTSVARVGHKRFHGNP